MKSENWVIENGKLVCLYETYNGNRGRKEFTFTGASVNNGVVAYSFEQEGTKYRLGMCSWNTLLNCYSALYNNTPFSKYIDADLSVFNPQQ